MADRTQRQASGTVHAGGEWRPALSGATRDILDPADGRPFAVVAEGDEQDTDLAVAAARAAFDSGGWPRTPAAARAAVLRRVADLLVRDRERLGLLESRDAGKTLEEGRVDIDCGADAFRYFADLVAAEAPGRVVDAGSADIHSVVVTEPVGVCALITPWNYPLLQASWKIAPALAAGNTFVVKPSEITPLTTVELIGLLAEAGLPAGVANIVTGPGHTVGARLAEHPDVDLVSFTGGSASGTKVALAAAPGVKKVALELGGKNPNVVFADACATEEGFDTAVDQALNAAFIHSGQVCSAGARLIVEESVRDRFVAELARRAERIRLGRGTEKGVECGPLVSEQQRAKVEAYVDSALAEGAVLRCGGRRPEPAPERPESGYFYVRGGEVFVVMGLSGSGKSTLVRCLTRLIEPTAGTIAIDGEDVGAMDRTRLRELRRHRAAMVFQHFGLLPHRTVLDNVAYGLEIQGLGRAERRARAAEVVAKVGLDGMERRRPGQLSGGQRQRVGLARALAVDPQVLLFDEPFSALDPLIRRDMQEEVIRLHREEGRTMVFITHDLNEALKLGDRIALMRDGAVVQLGTPEDIVGSPADTYVREFVRDVPREQVLTVRNAMRPATAGEQSEGPAIRPRATVSEAIVTVARAGTPARVMDGSRCLGIVDHERLLGVVAGTVAVGGEEAV